MKSLATHQVASPLCIALALILFTPLTLGAQEITVAPVQPGWTGHAVAFQPASDSLAEGFLVVWGVEPVFGGEAGVYARRVTYPGALGDIVTLFPNKIGHDPAVAFGHVRRQYLATWFEEVDGLRLWGTVLNEDGGHCSPFLIHEYASGGFDEMAIAYNGDLDEWMVVWDGGTYETFFGLWGKTVADCTSLVGDEPFLVAAGGAGVSLAYNPQTGRNLAVWAQDGGEILGRLLTPDGAGDGSLFTVASCAVDCGTEEYQMRSAWAVYRPEEARWLVFWSEICPREEPDFSCADSARIYARFIVDGSCGELGGEELQDPEACLMGSFLVTDGAVGHSNMSAAAFNAKTQKFFSAWSQWPEGDPDDVDVYGQWLKSRGTGGLWREQIAVHANPATEEKTPEGGGHVACSDSQPHCLAVMNEYVFEGTPDDFDFWANILGVFVTAPEDCAVETNELWPPNHTLVDVGLSVEASDTCDDLPPAIAITVTSDEHPASAPGSGGSQYCPDAILAENGSVQLRAERSGSGDGRVYRIVTTATDSCGNVAICETSVGVPQHGDGSGGDAIDSGQLFDPTVCN